MKKKAAKVYFSSECVKIISAAEEVTVNAKAYFG
jgi:hypothetical protein